MDLADKLQIKAIEAKGLNNVNGLAPSPYVEITVGSDTKRIREVVDRNDPSWNAHPLIFEHVLGSGVQTILVYVYHYDETSDKKICLGLAAIPMDTFYHAPEVETDYWYDLTATAGMTDRVFNAQIRLKILYDNDVDADMHQPIGQEGTAAPNLLQITVHSVSEINTKGAVEAFVECQVGNFRKETKVCKKSVTPTWNEVLEIPTMDGNEMIGITLKQTTILRNIFMGRVRLTMNEVAAAGDAGITKVFTLLNENFEFSETNRGDINLSLKWIFDQATDDLNKRVLKTGSKSSIFSKITSLLKRKQVPPKVEEEVKRLIEDEGKDVQKGAAYDLSPLELSNYLEEQRNKRLEEINYLLEQETEEDIEMKEGDYTIQVNIVEVSDLVGLNASGLSDPVIVVEVMGVKKNTGIKKEVNSAYFDETLFFNFKDLKRDQLNDATIRMSVYDWNRFRRWELIGIYSVDLSSVYQSPNHELYRKWVSLRDPTNPEEFGSQGLMKFSATCLGPGDVQKIHDPCTEEEEDMMDMEVSEGAGVVEDSHGGNQTLQFLVFALQKAEGLPGFDRIISTMKSGLYTYVQVEFAGCKPLKTSKIAVSGKNNLTVKFEEELWIPVWVPSMSKRAAVTIMNRELGRRDQIIATAYVDFDSVPKYEKNPVAREGVLSFIGAGSQVYKGQNFQYLHFYGANPLVRGSHKAAMFMNRFPNHASAYRGSILCGIRVVKDTSGTNHGEAAHRLPLDYVVPDALIPPTASYVLKFMIYQGSDFGSKGKHAAYKGAKYALGISIGQYEYKSAFKTYEEGSVDWLQLIEVPDLTLPKEYKMIPDVFLTVYKGTEKSHQSVAFTRLKAIDILPRGKGDPQPLWYNFEHDLSHKSTNTVGYPGSGLLKILLSNVEDVEEQVSWEPERRKLEVKKPYCLRVLIFQCRNLPVVDEAGLIDPYVKVRFAGEKKKTQARKMTQNPIYYEALDFNQSLPEDLSLAPNILVQVWDNKVLNNAPVAALRCRVRDVPMVTNIHSIETPVPEWRALTGIDGKQKLGEILVSFQLFVKKDHKQTVPESRDLSPVLKKAYLDIHMVGLRGLLFKGKNTGVKKPSLQFDLGGGHINCTRITSKSSSTPLPSDPNFLDRQVVMVSLPEEPLYMPTLEIKCFDERMAGKILLGATTVDLLTKVPWNSEYYIEPRNHQIVADNIKEQHSAKLRRKGELQNVKRVKNSGQKAAADEEKVDSDDDDPSDSDDDGIVPQDTGVGVFPLDAKAKTHGAKYAELPVIKDRYQEEQERAERERKEEEDILKLKKDSDFNKVESGNSFDRLKKVIGIPTAWVNADFLKGREDWMLSKKPGEGGELEKFLGTYPFEQYYIFTGHIAFNKFGKRKNTIKKVGMLKAVIRVTLKNPRYDEEYGKFFKSVRQVTNCKVRLYVIKAQNLHHTEGMLGGAPDPYLNVSLGSTVFKDTKHMNSSTTAPEFFQCYEFDTRLPGPSLLKVKIMDKNYIRSDAELGETVIDLEDRWFHPKWTARELKPCEIRTLYKDSSQSAQGAVMLWVDIIPQSDVLKFPKIEIMGPEKMKFELRIICWRSDNVKVPGQKSLDIFNTFYLEGDDKHKQHTDCHWFCKNGKGSWNWRIKIPVELPIKARELGRLKVQMWEKNIITSNTIIGEASVSLYDWFMLVYRRQSSVSPYKEIKDAEKKVNKLGFSAEPDTAMDAAEELLADMPDTAANEEDEERELDDGSGDIETGKNPIHASLHEVDLEDDTKPLLQKEKMFAAPGAMARTPTPAERRRQTQQEEKEAAEDEDEETAQLLNLVQSTLGLGDAIAEDADWLTMTYHNRTAGKIEDRGKLAISIQILPEAEVATRPAGHGRSEPNDNPYLPPPVGRFKFSFNPWSLLLGLCGPRLLALLCCICCCVCFLGVFFFLSSYLSGFYSLIELFKGV